MSRRSIRLATAGAALAALAAVAGPVSPASAHNTVIAISPDGEETVVEQPGTVWLETNDALIDTEGAAAMDVVGPDGRHYATGCAAVDGPIASVAAELGEPGEYTVVWRVVSADGHPISGDFSFDWDPADGQALAEGATESPCASTIGSGDAEGTDAEADDEASTTGSGATTDLIWIGAGAVAVIAAALVAFLFVRRRPGHDAATEAAPSDGTSTEPAEAHHASDGDVAPADRADLPEDDGRTR